MIINDNSSKLNKFSKSKSYEQSFDEESFRFREKSNVEEYVRTQMKKDAILKIDNREKYTRMSQITIQKVSQ